MTGASSFHSNKFGIFVNLCDCCNSFTCACTDSLCSADVIPDTRSADVIPDTNNFISDAKQDTTETNIDVIIETKAKEKTSKFKDKANSRSVSGDRVSENLRCSSVTNEHNHVLSFNLSDKGLNFGHLNIQGICGKNMNKFSELKALLTAPENNNLHIFGLSETKLKERKMSNAFVIDGYQAPFRKDNNSNGGGGIIVYVKNGINVKRREDLEINEISCIWIEITQEKGKSFLVGNMYRPPDSRVEYNDRFEDFIDTVTKEGKEIILLGDLNKNLIGGQADKEWLNLTLSLGLSQMVDEPTRVTENSSTLIDHIYTNIEENITRVTVCKSAISDHYAIFGNRKLNSFIRKHSHQTITYRSFKDFDENAFIHDLSLVPWEIIQNFDDINEIVRVWNSLFLEVVNKHAPLKSHRIKRQKQPDWLSSEIIDCIKARNKCKINGKTNEYKYLRNKVSSMIDLAKKEMYKVKIEEGQNDPRSIWKLFRDFGASKKGGSHENILGIKVNDQVIANDSDIADIFNNYFVNVASQLKEPAQFSEFQMVKDYVDSKVQTDTYFTIPEINSVFVRKFLTNLDVTKATGLDCIGPRLLKIAPNSLCTSLTFIVNKSLSAGIFPNAWKQAKVNPIFKSGTKDDVNNYRPISILPTLSKLIEKWIQIKFMSFLNTHQLLQQRQSGFRPGHSTESALVLMIDTWLKAIDEGKLVGSVMVDFRKAFDLVDHRILLKKLSLYKCNEKCLAWFESYLTNRNQLVSVNGMKSGSESVVCGVPQGSILGPLLFLIFINDLPLALGNSVMSTDLYADDTTLYDVQSDKHVLEKNLQHSLLLLKKWCKENGMLLNTEKTKVMLIASRQKRSSMKDNTLSLKYNDIDLQITSSDKILGVHIDENLKWNAHFQFVAKKVSSYLWLLSQIRSYLSIEHRLLFYNSYIRTHFDYCSIIWGNSSNFNVSKITKLQRRACKIILGNEYTSLEEARTRLKILSFDESVFIQKAKVMYKIVNNIAPVYLSDMFQMRGNNINDTTVNLRSMSNKNFIIPKPNTNLFKNSLSYSGAIVWNSIPPDFKKATNINSFASKCMTWMRC
ncbi:MAG: hypothetical protein KZQ70_08805 [gamma proteobacterium symbiont of Lucinoma myriamae]|nr:hypothetical protein [gamma proteobacterium symbiont of Lucinoma myriamae]